MEITLALGGGGAKGIAHVGVIRRLEQVGLRIRAVAGTSFGGIVSAFYALGYSTDRIEEAFNTVDQNQLFGYTADQGPSLLGISGFSKWLTAEIGDMTFADTQIPCVLTAGDLKSGREVLLSEGPIVPAILATIALPGIFPSTLNENYELVDGGVVDPVPVAPARALFPQLPVVAVVLNEPAGTVPPSLTLPTPEGWSPMILERVSKTRYMKALDIFLRSMDMINCNVAEYRLAIDKPDVIIRPPVTDVELLGKVNIHGVVKRGEMAADAAMPAIKEVFSWQYRLQKKIGLR